MPRYTIRLGNEVACPIVRVFHSQEAVLAEAEEQLRTATQRLYFDVVEIPEGVMEWPADDRVSDKWLVIGVGGPSIGVRLRRRQRERA